MVVRLSFDNRYSLSSPARCAGRIVLLAAMLLPACGDPPVVPSPLPRSLGDVRGVIAVFEGLQTIPEEVGIYGLWISSTDKVGFLGTFNINESGQTVDRNGNLIPRFTTPETNLAKALSVVVTVELFNSNPETPSGNVILQGPFSEGVARMSVPIPSAIKSAAGTYLVQTPTDGPNTNEASGIWAIDAEGNPTLDLSEATAGYIYEHFIFIEGRMIIMGRFNVADELDSINPYIDDLFPPPEVPGDDFLRNDPAGLDFPTNLSGSRLIVTLEPRVLDHIFPSQLVVLEAFLPLGLVGGETITMINTTANFPTGTVIQF